MPACDDNYLCIQQDVAASPVGWATGDAKTSVLVLDPATGRSAALSDVVPDMAQLTRAMNEAVASQQKAERMFDASFPPDLTQEDISAWAPIAGGIQLWFDRGIAGAGAMGVVSVYISPLSLVEPEEPAVRWYAIKDSPSDPLYAFPVQIQPQSDGSYVLTADPLSPDTEGTLDPGCGTWSFASPYGDFCLVNTTVRTRKVTVLPSAEIGINDDFVSIEELDNFLASNRSIVMLGLDDRGYVNSLWSLGYDPTERPPTGGSQASCRGVTMVLSTSVVGMLGSVGISAVDPSTGDIDLGRILDQMWARWYGSSTEDVGVRQVKIDLNGGWMGSDIATLFGADPSAASRMRELVLAKAANGGSQCA